MVVGGLQVKRFLTALLAIILFFGFNQGTRAETNTGFITYSVQQGDTFWLLAQRYGSTVATLQQLNKLPDDALSVGQALYIPVNLKDSNYLYRVQRGDTLYLISLRTGRSTETIKTANSLQNDWIYPDQILVIPHSRPGNLTYRVQPGDTLYLIGKKFGVSPAELYNINGLPSDMIMVGQLLEIPVKNDPPVVPEPPSAPELVVYRVATWDTLSTIAQKFGITVKAIYETNRLNSDILMPGQPLYIPPGSSPVSLSGPKGEIKPGFGEFLEWQWVRWHYNVGSVATITDINSGLTFKVRHLGGSNHADSEPLTAADTKIMKQVFGGYWSWNSRPAWVHVNGRTFAASISGQPHGVETITDNNFPGHFDVYFWNSRSHNTNEIQPQHQANVLKAAGR